MKTKQALYLGAAVAVLALAATAPTELRAQQSRGGRGRRRRHRRRRHRPRRTGSGRVGDRGDAMICHQVRQDGGDRRPGTLRHSRSPEGELHRVGARLRARRFAEGDERARQAREPDRDPGADAGRGRGILSRHVLVLDAQDSGRERIPRHRPQGQRHSALHEDPGRLDRHREELLPELPCDRLEGHPHAVAQARDLQELPRGLGAAHPVRPGDVQHGDLDRASRARQGHRALCRLDRPHRRRRAADVEARAAEGHRAQRRDHHVGLGHQGDVPPRRDREREVRSARQRQRPDLRLAGGKLRPRAGDRSGQEHVLDHQAPLSRPADAVDQDQHRGTLGVLGRRPDLGQPHQHPQSDDRRATAGCGSPRRSGPTRIRRSARRDRTSRRRRSRRSRTRSASSRCTIRRRRSGR